MRRRAMVVVLAGLAACVAGTARADVPEVQVGAPWALESVGPTQHALRIAYVIGGCVRDQQYTVQETATTVLIRVMHLEPAPGFQTACPADIGCRQVIVPLQRPLAGRRLPGWDDGVARTCRELVPPDTALVMPGVVGLRTADARRVLRNGAFRFRERGRRHGRRVVGQRPRLGARTHGRPVVIVLG